MRYIILIYLLSTYVFAQNIHIAHYDYEYIATVKEVSDKNHPLAARLQYFIDAKKEYANEVKVRLLFGGNRAVSISNVEDINSRNKVAFVGCSCTESIYFDRSKKNIQYFNRLSVPLGVQKGTYLLVEPLDKEWNLINETKKISEYTAYKAELQELDGDRYRTVTAWYVPELPYPYGPVNYGGLPGLIVQVQSGGNMFTLSKLELNNTTETLPEVPHHSKIKSAKEFYEEQYKAISRM